MAKNWMGGVIEKEAGDTALGNVSVQKALNEPQFLDFLSRAGGAEEIKSKETDGQEKIEKLFELFNKQKEAVKTITEVLTEDINLIYRTELDAKALKGVAEHVENMAAKDTEQFIRLAELATAYKKTKDQMPAEEKALQEALTAAGISGGENIGNEQAIDKTIRQRNITDATTGAQAEKATIDAMEDSWGDSIIKIKRFFGAGKAKKTRQETALDANKTKTDNINSAQEKHVNLARTRDSFIDARKELRVLALNVGAIKTVIQKAVKGALVDAFENTKKKKPAVKAFVQGQNILEAVQGTEDFFEVNEKVAPDMDIAGGINEKAKTLVDTCLKETVEKGGNFETLKTFETALRPILQSEKVGNKEMKDVLKAGFDAKIAEIKTTGAKNITNLDAKPDKSAEEIKELALLRKKAIVLSFVAQNYLEA